MSHAPRHDPVAWVAASDVPSLERECVHVWRADLAPMRAHRDALSRILGPDELARARAFHAAVDADRHIVSHGVLRHLLSRYVGVAPEAIDYCVGPFGKPRLCLQRTLSAVSFNMSHTHDVMIFAVALEREIGVDVERWANDVEFVSLARNFFSARESATLVALPERARQAAFFAAWSRKEAYIKATGFGVSQGLDHFDVSLGAGEPARLLADRSDPAAVLTWRMQDLALEDGLSGAVVAAGHDWTLRTFAVTPTLLGG